MPPPDYRWPATEDKWELGVCGVQPLDVDTSPELIEKASGTDLLIAMPHLPRPREGGCECEVCVVTVLPNYQLVPTPFSVAAGFNLNPHFGRHKSARHGTQDDDGGSVSVQPIYSRHGK